ncbi:MAG: lauroyl acyltransferase [Pseudomonadota bacterium]|nr:lauroyl acyltransferase [Pseudomonadota bacterium]
MKRFKYLIETAGLAWLFAIFRMLPLDAASWVGGFLMRAIGPLLPAHRTAANNLSLAFPAMPAQEKRRLLAAMWDNLGRTAAELPHLSGEALHRRVTLHGTENIPAEGRPTIFFSGHLGNWELTYPLAHHRGLPVTLIYRKANNPYVDKIITRIRATQSTDMLPKGPGGSIKLARTIKSGRSLAMLVDQKMNDGISVPFFGRNAMTAPAIAEFALRYGMPLIPVRVVRVRGCHFEAFVYPPLHYEKTGDEARDVLAIMTQINALLESWIREHPEQWFWVHKRWPRD